MTTQERINALESEILASKAYLDNTDYKIIKQQEPGEQVEENVLSTRAAARLKINENEGLLVALYEQLEEERIINPLNE